MGVTTTADVLISEAKEKIREAIRMLTNAMDCDTWGSDDFKKEYVDDVWSVIIEINNAVRKLK